MRPETLFERQNRNPIVLLLNAFTSHRPKARV